MAELRSRRSNLAVPGSSQKFIDKARTLNADQVFLDLEDACAPLAKPGALLVALVLLEQTPPLLALPGMVAVVAGVALVVRASRPAGLAEPGT